VIGEHAGSALDTFQRRPRHTGPGAVRSDDAACTYAHKRLVLGCAVRTVDDDRGAISVALDRFPRAGAAFGAGGRGTGTQPFVEMLAVDHADEASLDRHVDFAVGRRDHSSRACAPDQDILRHVEIEQHPRRYRTAARLDPPGAVEQQHAATGRGEISCGSRTGRPAADDDNIIGLGHTLISNRRGTG